VGPHGGLVLDRDWKAALTRLMAGLAWLAAHRTAGQAETGAASAARSHFGTDHLYGGVRQSASHAGWLNEESPGFNRESVKQAIFGEGFGLFPELRWKLLFF